MTNATRPVERWWRSEDLTMTTRKLQLRLASEQGGTWVSDHHTARRYVGAKAAWAAAHGQTNITISVRLARALLQGERTRRPVSSGEAA